MKLHPKIIEDNEIFLKIFSVSVTFTVLLYCNKDHHNRKYKCQIFGGKKKSLSKQEKLVLIVQYLVP